MMRVNDRVIIKDFHKLWRRSLRNDQLEFMGNQVCKSPMDMWIYQELLWSVKPGLVIECGTYLGGTVYYLACMMEVIGNGKVVSIDVVQQLSLPTHHV